MVDENKVIMYESPEAASVKTITGWVSSSGRFWANDEHMARYCGSTHKLCECGNRMTKSYIICQACRDSKATEKYLAMPFEKYTGQPVWSASCHEYFFTEESIREHAHFNEIENLDDLQLVICVPQYIEPIDLDWLFEDLAPEELGLADYAPEIFQKFVEVNKFIEEKKHIASWIGGNVRTSLEPERATQ